MPPARFVDFMPTKKAIELIRVSTQGQAGDGRASIPAQRAINQRTAGAYGLEIVDTIELVNVSGAAVLRTGPHIDRQRITHDGNREHSVPRRRGTVGRGRGQWRLRRADSFDACCGKPHPDGRL